MVTDELIDALNATLFWRRLVADPELQVVCVYDRLSVAYGAYDFFSHVHLVDGEILCLSELSAVPDRTRVGKAALGGRQIAEHRVDFEGRARLHPRPEPVEVLDASAERLEAYKAELLATKNSLRRFHHTVAFGTDTSNCVVTCRCRVAGCWDYEYVVLRGEERIATPVNLRSMREHHPSPLPKNVAVSMERLARLWRREEGHTIKDLNQTLILRRRLGAAGSLQESNEQVVRMAERPIIAIGDCSEAEIEMITERKGPWSLLSEDGLDERCEVIPFWQTLRL